MRYLLIGLYVVTLVSSAHAAQNQAEQLLALCTEKGFLKEVQLEQRIVELESALVKVQAAPKTPEAPPPPAPSAAPEAK